MLPANGTTGSGMTTAVAPSATAPRSSWRQPLPAGHLYTLPRAWVPRNRAARGPQRTSRSTASPSTRPPPQEERITGQYPSAARGLSSSSGATERQRVSLETPPQRSTATRECGASAGVSDSTVTLEGSRARQKRGRPSPGRPAFFPGGRRPASTPAAESPCRPTPCRSRGRTRTGAGATVWRRSPLPACSRSRPGSRPR